MTSKTLESRPLVIGVTGLDARDNPHPGVALARCLACMELGRAVRLIGLTYDVLCTGTYRRDLIERSYLVPSPTEREAVLLARLEEIHARERFDLIFPALDSEVAVYARAAEELARQGIHTLLPSERSVKKRAKEILPVFCKRHGIHMPETRVITTLAQLEEPGFALTFPFYLKASIVDAGMVRNLDEARVVYRRLLRDWGYPILMQERVVGDEFNVTLSANRDHEIDGLICTRKFGITRKGKGYSGVVIDHAELNELAHRIVRLLEWVGPAELEFIREQTTGKFHLIEINARFPAGVSICSCGGLNLPEIAVRRALGLDLGALPDPPLGMLFVRNIRPTIMPIEVLGQFLMEGCRS